MPELPEVETLRRSLLPHLLGVSLREVRVRRTDVVTGSREGSALLAGDRVAELTRHGKQMAMLGDSGRVVVVQLGMTGQVLVNPPAGMLEERHTHVVWTTTRGVIVFRDPRRFGGITTLPSRAALAERFAALGPDALSIDGAVLGLRLRAAHRAVKAALLDQGCVAGVGNIYADEALFRAGVRPRSMAARLTHAKCAAIAERLREVLSEAVEAGGSTVRDYRNAEGAAGVFAGSHLVYGRAGLPCSRCGTLLRGGTVAQRTTVWCPVCQR